MAEGSSRATEGMLSLSWNNHSAAFTQTLATLREKETYTDVTLACGGKFYPVHKLVLSTCSDYFLQMFERTSCKHPIIVLKDVQCREMEALLSYMYLGIVCVPQSDLAQLIMVAETLQIKGLAVPDETMCTNKRLSHTWSPTDDRISPHAKRLRHDDNGAGTQYQRFSDGHTIIKPQTLTGIPSFAGVVPQTRVSSPSVSSVVKHMQPSIRPAYTTLRYSPYPRETERQHSSPRQVLRLDVQELQGTFRTDQKQDAFDGDTGRQSDMKLAKAQFTHSNGSEAAASQRDSQNSISEIDKEILPETLVKVEVEDVDEPLQLETSIVDHVHPSDKDCSQSQAQSMVDVTDLSKAEVSRSEGERKEESASKEEGDFAIKFEPGSEGSAGGNDQPSISQQSQTLKVEPLDVQAVPSSHKEISERSMDTGSNWERDEESAHPLDLSDSQKQHTHQVSECDSPRVIKRLHDTRFSKFPCPYCSFKATQKSLLSKHIRIHTAENPFSCPYCPFTAPLHISLKEHMNTHKSNVWT